MASISNFPIFRGSALGDLRGDPLSVAYSDSSSSSSNSGLVPSGGKPWGSCDELASGISCRFLGHRLCQIRIEISDYTGKISVGVARPSRIGQSVLCDGWHSILGTRVRHMCTESGIRAQGLITRATASWQLTDDTGIRSIQLTTLVMRSKCSWLITLSAAVSTQYSY